jgi:hypothetical protein
MDVTALPGQAPLGALDPADLERGMTRLLADLDRLDLVLGSARSTSPPALTRAA